MKPTKDGYDGVMHAYGNARPESDFASADGVLRRMMRQHADGNESARPDANSFHAVIRACSKLADSDAPLERRTEALLLAISTVRRMKKSNVEGDSACYSAVAPTAKSYLLLLRCCSGLLPPGSPERDRALRSIFRSCAKDGLVNRYVLREFRSSASHDDYDAEEDVG